MKSGFSFRKRAFLMPQSTGLVSYVLAEVESSRAGRYQWGQYMLTIADCGKRLQLEFFLGSKRARRMSLAKINLLINILTSFRDALIKEIELIDKVK